jgi:hypothetical protein
VNIRLLSILVILKHKAVSETTHYRYKQTMSITINFRIVMMHLIDVLTKRIISSRKYITLSYRASVFLDAALSNDTHQRYHTVESNQ